MTTTLASNRPYRVAVVICVTLSFLPLFWSKIFGFGHSDFVFFWVAPVIWTASAFLVVAASGWKWLPQWWLLFPALLAWYAQIWLVWFLVAVKLAGGFAP
jgi:hypothetical protein